VDPGAHGINGTNEKIITLAIAKELKAQLESTGRYRVALTRSDDRFIKLRDRVKIARQKEADLFISIHADSIGHSDVSGVSVYTLSEKASDAQTAKLAEQENKSDLIAGIDLSTEDKEVASILVDLAMRDTMNQSGFFANTFLKKLQSHKLNILDKPHRSAGFAVLKAPDIPSVLVETGFMSNKKEAALLSTPAYRKKIASSLREAVDAYFEKVRKNQRI
ncbi:MAG: N-acetylmuramoyl-L-alanine amidase, partial [Alphaproteobacteria bacterium]